jgi:hypothetical protein
MSEPLLSADRFENMAGNISESFGGFKEFLSKRPYFSTIFFIGMFLIIYYLYLRIKGEIEARKNAVYPPYVSQCPDYWRVVGPSKCLNVHYLGNTNKNDQPDPSNDNQPRDPKLPPDTETVVEFKADNGYTDTEEGLNNRCRWAKHYQVAWEGIDNRAC